MRISWPEIISPRFNTVYLIQHKSIDFIIKIHLLEKCLKLFISRNPLRCTKNNFKLKTFDFLIAIFKCPFLTKSYIGGKLLIRNIVYLAEFGAILDQRQKWHDDEGYSFAQNGWNLEGKRLASSGGDQAKAVLSTHGGIDDSNLILSELMQTKLFLECS